MKKMLAATVLIVAGLTMGGSFAQENNDAASGTTTTEGAAAGGQAQQPELTPEQQAEARATIEIAQNLASYGETKGDALALVTAAKMLSSVPGRVLAPGETGAEGKSIDIEAMLKKAEDLSQGDELIARVAADARAAAEANARGYCVYAEYCYGGWCEWAYECYY
ncbi:MAG TPA: hypothetical protein VGN97_19805 [Mesorhizobium sp.]|nr:hypothetical protein [Mesorhizobium sp.]